MNDARIVFMGTPEFGKEMLVTLVEEGYNVVACVTQPDKAVGRKQIITFSETKKYALEHNIPVIQPIKIKDEYQDVLDYNPDLIVTCAYGQFVPSVVLNAPKFGSINVHASLLPALRGGAPIQHAIIDGYDKTGVTIMEMAKKMDAGNIISMVETDILESDTYGSLHDRLIPLAKQLLKETMPVVLSGNHPSVVQDENLATFGLNILKEEERVDLTKSYKQVYNQIRGLIPVPCSYIVVDGKKIKIHEVAPTDQTSNKENGTLFYQGNDLALVVDSKVLLIKQLQLEGKNKMSAKEFKNGAGRNYENKKCD